VNFQFISGNNLLVTGLLIVTKMLKSILQIEYWNQIAFKIHESFYTVVILWCHGGGGQQKKQDRKIAPLSLSPSILSVLCMKIQGGPQLSLPPLPTPMIRTNVHSRFGLLFIQFRLYQSRSLFFFFVWVDFIIRCSVWFFWASLQYHLRELLNQVSHLDGGTGGRKLVRGRPFAPLLHICSSPRHQAPFVHCWAEQSNVST